MGTSNSETLYEQATVIPPLSPSMAACSHVDCLPGDGCMVCDWISLYSMSE